MEGDQSKFLCGNGQWVTVSAGGSSLGFLPIVRQLAVTDWVQSGQQYVCTITDQAITNLMVVSSLAFDDAVNIPATIYDSVDGANHAVILTTSTAPLAQVTAYIGLTADGSTVMEDVSELTTPFIGATSTTDGREGLVPKPFIADRGKFLKANGEWENAQASEIVYGSTNVGAALTSQSDQIVALGPYNGLDSSSTTKALSAAQGKAINDLFIVQLTGSGNDIKSALISAAESIFQSIDSYPQYKMCFGMIVWSGYDYLPAMLLKTSNSAVRIFVFYSDHLYSIVSSINGTQVYNSTLTQM